MSLAFSSAKKKRRAHTAFYFHRLKDTQGSAGSGGQLLTTVVRALVVQASPMYRKNTSASRGLPNKASDERRRGRERESEEGGDGMMGAGKPSPPGQA